MRSSLGLRHVGEHDPELGDHFSKVVRTGTFCAYAPDARAAIQWTVTTAPSHTAHPPP